MTVARKLSPAQIELLKRAVNRDGSVEVRGMRTTSILAERGLLKHTGAGWRLRFSARYEITDAGRAAVA